MAADGQSGSTTNGHGTLSHELNAYSLPTQSLTTKLNTKDTGRTPLVIVGCGSFSPITYLHLRMFEMARDWVRRNSEFVVIGGYLSPVGDAYVKKGLAPAEHRVNMCRRAVETQDQKTRFVMVDNWEALQTKYQPTAIVLDHFNHELNVKMGGIDDGTGKKVKVHIALLGGADLVETFSQPGVWSDVDLTHILCEYGAFIIERTGTNIDEALSKLRPEWRKNIRVIHQRIRNDVSSTQIRAFLGEDLSIRFLVPEPVIQYIEDHSLYGVHRRDSEQEAAAA